MRTKPPTAEEITRKAKEVRLLPGRAATLEQESATLEVIPTKLKGIRSMEDLEEGQVVSVVRSKAAKERAGVKPDHHNVFLAKIGDAWHVYTECGGEVTEQAHEPKPQFHYWGEERYNQKLCMGV